MVADAARSWCAVTPSCIPALAYPTYDVGARLAGARPIVV